MAEDSSSLNISTCGPPEAGRNGVPATQTLASHVVKRMHAAASGAAGVPRSQLVTVRNYRCDRDPNSGCMPSSDYVVKWTSA